MTRFARAPDVLWRRCLDGVVVASCHTSASIALEGGSADLWMVLDGELDQTDAARRLEPNWSDGADVAALLMRLAELGFVVRVERIDAE